MADGEDLLLFLPLVGLGAGVMGVQPNQGFENGWLGAKFGRCDLVWCRVGAALAVTERHCNPIVGVRLGSLLLGSKHKVIINRKRRMV